ncbi:MAG TPA: SRPBCC domain-containing protein [Gaiellaceae bacterium]|nr:SRPBCC domain-containing protein [Gaiellaceae bacterium]
MATDRIEREIEIDAPVDVVWTVITEPEHINGWFTDTAEIEVREGAKGRLGWTEKARHRETFVNLKIERVEPPSLLAFRWNYPDDAEPSPSNAPLVEFTLEPRGDGTHLRIVESGLESVDRSDEAKESYFDEHSSGWSVIVERLRAYAAEQRSTVVG